MHVSHKIPLLPSLNFHPTCVCGCATAASPTLNATRGDSGHLVRRERTAPQSEAIRAIVRWTVHVCGGPPHRACFASTATSFVRPPPGARGVPPPPPPPLPLPTSRPRPRPRPPRPRPTARTIFFSAAEMPFFAGGSRASGARLHAAGSAPPAGGFGAGCTAVLLAATALMTASSCAADAGASKRED